MDYENFKTGFNKAAIFTAQTYGTKTTVEVDHSDLSLDEVMDAFQTLIIGMGYHENSFKSWVKERAEEYIETDAEELKEKLEAWKFENDDNEVDDLKRLKMILAEIEKFASKTKEEKNEFLNNIKDIVKYNQEYFLNYAENITPKNIKNIISNL